MSTGQQRSYIDHLFDEPVAAVALRPSRPILAAVQLQPTRIARILVVASPGQMPAEVDVPSRTSVVAMAFSPDGRTLALCSARSVRLWDVGSRQTTVQVIEPVKIQATAFSPDGQTLATGTNDGIVRFHHVPTGHQRAAYDWQIGPITALAFAPDGMRAAAGGKKGTIVVWDVDG